MSSQGQSCQKVSETNTKQMCTCDTCLEHMNGALTYNPWVISFREALASGEIQHIGYNLNGQPIYRKV